MTPAPSRSGPALSPLSGFAAGPVVHLNGWPGAGKQTIARHLAARLGGRLIPNHALINPAAALYGRNDPGFGRLRREVTALVMDHAVALPAHLRLVLTNALAEEDEALLAPVRALAARRQAPLISVVLEISEQENLARLTAPGRAAQGKLTSPRVLRDLYRRHRLMHPEADAEIACDVTALGAEAAADQIAAALAALAKGGSSAW